MLEFFALIAALLYTFWNKFSEYLVKVLKKTNFIIELNWQLPGRVGETVSLTVWINNKSKNPIVIQRIVDDLSIEIQKGDLSVVAVKESIVPESEAQLVSVQFKFCVRVSGEYCIKVLHKRRNVEGSPLKIAFLPAPVEPEKTTFLRSSRVVVCTSNEKRELEIQPKDRYDNRCQLTDVTLSNFEFHTSIANGGSCQEENLNCLKYEFIPEVKIVEDRVRFIVTFYNAGVFHGRITYKDKDIHNGKFTIVVISREESNRLNSIITSGSANWQSFEGKLLAQGSDIQKVVRKVFLYVSPSLLYVREYFLRIFPLRIVNFRLSTMTKIDVEFANDDNGSYVLTISDRIQPKVVIEINASLARIMMAMFSHYLSQRMGGSESFDCKQRVFSKNLREANTDIRFTTKLVRISRHDLIESTYKITKTFRTKDWCKNFRVEFRNEPGIDGGGLRREWLNQLCLKLFQNNEKGLFSSLGNSRLVHPNDSQKRSSHWKLYHYNLAGNVVGKCMYETAFGDSYKQMVNGRFSRSFLAQIIGLHPNYRYFEQDDPELYLGKVKYILENDVDGMELTFSEEEYNNEGKLLKVIDLLPGGSKIAVTNETKEEYLNLLAKYRLSTRVHKEIEAFLKGLHEIVPDELLCNFDENELEILMCGKSEFDVSDLKKNYASSNWQWDSNARKILDWFWAAIGNMTEDEKGRLLQFTTGSALLPHGGFKSLEPKFNIEFTGRIGSLPTAQTCVNRICLPDHFTFELFENNLRLAIYEGSEGFGFA